MPHEHHDLPPHADEMSPLDEFKILLEERPEQADRVLRWARDMHQTVRNLLADQQRLCAVDNLIEPARTTSIDPCWSDAQLGALIGTMGVRQSLMGNALNEVNRALDNIVGCFNDSCSNAWVDFFDPPEVVLDEDEGGVTFMGPFSSDGIAQFLGNLFDCAEQVEQGDDDDPRG